MNRTDSIRERRPPQTLRCVLVDPSLFTPPYDAALTAGLLAAGVEPHWVTRPVRRGDREEIPSQYVSTLFYKRVDELAKLPRTMRALVKGVAHLAGLVRLLRLVHRRRPDVIHVQWVVLPLLDLIALRLIRKYSPIVMTVHDPLPYNGQKLSFLQRVGFDGPVRLADHVIVHTLNGRATLIARGIAPEKISVVPHGPLALPVKPRQRVAPRDPRWTFVAFGEIKPYKGLDILIAAMAQLPRSLREQARLIIAGRPRMDIQDLERSIREQELEDCVSLHARRLTEQEMADLFAEADCFVFPYRAIDASGVYFLTKSLGKWIIASRVGIFAEDLREDVQGTLVPKEDVPALAAALAAAISSRPQPAPPSSAEGWASIGSLTKAIYRQVGERA